MNKRALAVALLLSLTACGGGGGGTSLPVPVALPTTSPVLGPSATLTLTIPRGAGTSSAFKSPQYVSPNTTSIQITVVSVDGKAPTATQVPVNPSTVALSTGSGGNCTATAGGETCTITIPAPTGSDVKYTFALLDAAGHTLATNTVDFSIGAGSTTNMSAQLYGVVATVSLTAPTLTPGTPSSGPLTLQVFDASGAPITGSGPYANSFTLTDTDQTGSTQIGANGQFGPTFVVNGPNVVVTLTYNGSMSIQSFTITVTGANVTGGGNVAVSGQPTPTPTPTPTASPTSGPTTSPSSGPTSAPTSGPTPTPVPTGGPTAAPTSGPTPTPVPTGIPTGTPTAVPTPTPTPAPGSITFVGTALGSQQNCANPGDSDFNQPTLCFTSIGSSQTFSAQQSGNSMFTLALDPASCGSGATAVVQAPVTMDNQTFTITSQATGICMGTVTGAGGVQATLYFNVTTNDLHVNGRKRKH